VCFGCACWIERAPRLHDPLHWIIDGKLYSCDRSGVCENRKPRRPDWVRGFGGDTFTIESLTDGSQIVVDDLWCGGHVPKWLDKETGVSSADTAKFISQ
jgi:hypothetical protein